MPEHKITNFKLMVADEHYDSMLNKYYIAVTFRGEYRGEAFITSTRCSPETWKEQSELVTESALESANEFVETEEKDYGYFDETDKETD